MCSSQVRRRSDCTGRSERGGQTNSKHWSTTSWRKVPESDARSDARSVHGGLHGEISSCKHCSKISSCKYCAAVSCAQWYTRHRILYAIRLETGNLYYYYLPCQAQRHRRFSDSITRISTFLCLSLGLVIWGGRKSGHNVTYSRL